MVKYCTDKYPMGSFKGQQSPGKYLNGFLYQNLELLASKIVDDMTFLGIIYSSTLEVGTGKSVLATQIGEAWSDIIKSKHGIDLPYNVDNIIWRPKDLIERAFKVPKYSYLLLDEWEDSTYWSELGMTLRQFFRKCRQLNLFIMVIIPNFFQLPINYAISRSVFAIDVRFTDKLERGLFSFYNFPAKRILYVAGKRGHNYKVVKPTFVGNFVDGYGVDEAEYRKRKYEDMVKYDQENPVKKTKAQIERENNIKILEKLKKKFPELTRKQLGELFGVHESTITEWNRGVLQNEADGVSDYTNETITKKDITVNERELEEIEQKNNEYIEEPEEPSNIEYSDEDNENEEG